MIFNSKSVQLNFVNSVAFLTYPSLSTCGCVNHAFSTRIGGISRGEFSSMNLSFERGDSDEAVTENYRIFCNAAGFDYETLVSSEQRHGTNVRVVTEKDCGIGVQRPHDMQNIDALITDRHGVTLVTHYADCTPIFLADPVRKCIGLIHSGWRGTVAEICRHTVKAMQENYGSNPQNIIAAVGPAISMCCFEVDKPVADEFDKLSHLDRSRFIKDDNNGKFHIDLLECNRQILVNSGLLPQNITISDICTKCNHDLLFSHRATAGRRGGMVAMMCLK